VEREIEGTGGKNWASKQARLSYQSKKGERKEKANPPMILLSQGNLWLGGGIEQELETGRRTPSVTHVGKAQGHRK